MTQPGAEAAPRLLGPVVSTDDPGRWDRLLIDGFGLARERRDALDAAAVEERWGVAGQTAVEARYETPGMSSGITVLALSAPGESIRDPSRGHDADALKVIDFFAPDGAAAAARLADAGFAVKDDIAEYPVEDTVVTERHLWGPDGVVFGILSGELAFFERFVTRVALPFSEVMSVSAPVSDPVAVAAFYASLGLAEVYRYGIDDDSFDTLVGEQAVRLRSWNYGRDLREPYVGIVHYGLPNAAFSSLQDQARLPRRGLVGLEVAVGGLATQSGDACRIGPHGVAHWLRPVTA